MGSPITKTYTCIHSNCHTPSSAQTHNMCLFLLMLSWPHSLFLYWAWPINILGLKNVPFVNPQLYTRQREDRQRQAAVGITAFHAEISECQREGYENSLLKNSSGMEISDNSRRSVVLRLFCEWMWVKVFFFLICGTRDWGKHLQKTHNHNIT